MLQGMLLRSRKVLMATACTAGVWMVAAPASAQVQQPAAGPGPTEWFREGANNPVGVGTPTIAPAAPAAPEPGAFVPAAPAAVAVPPAAPANVGLPPAAANNVAPPAVIPPAPGQRPYRMPPISGNSGNGYGSVGGLYPSNEMNSYAAAMARAATARALFRLADSELGQAYRAAQRQFDASLEYRQALKEEKDAYDALTAARSKAFASLSSDNKYQRLLALRQDLSDRLDDMRARRALSQEEIIAMANLKMSYSTEMRSYEMNAMNNEPTVKQSQDRLVTAGARVSELRQHYSDSLRTSPEILMARRNLEDARIAKLTAEAYLHAAMENGSYALDYAYYLYRRPGNGGYNNGADYSYAGGGYFR
jgi:hypothetical protein